MAIGPRCFKWKMLNLSGPKALLFLQLLISLLTRSVVNVCAISKDFLFVSLVTNQVSLEEVFLPSFDVLNCWLILAAICLDDATELPLKVIASFSSSRFALPSIPLMFLHSLVASLFWSKVSTKSLNFCLLCAVLDVIIQSWQFRRGEISFTAVITSNISAGTGFFYGGHHIQYLRWYRFLVESVSSSRDVV